MEESSTYLAILDEGDRKRFGPASDDVVTTVKGIENLERLELLLERVLDVSSWQELLQVP